MNFNNTSPHFDHTLISNLIVAFLSTFIFQTSLYSLDDNNTVSALLLLNKNIQDVNTRLDKLEKGQQDNRLVIYKDIDSIYDYVIGDDYKFKSDSETNVTGIYYKPWWYKDTVVYKNTTSSVRDTWFYFDGKLEGEVSKYKLLAVEESLNVKYKLHPPLDSNSTTVERIEKIYTILKYDDWNRDRIQFTILTNYVTKEKAPMISIGVLAFGSYKKYIPGKFDFWRRYAFYLGIGKIESLDETHEYSSIAYSTGINVEIQKGFGLNLGWALYSAKNLSVVTNPTTTENSYTWGVTLSSELWKNLFNFNKEQ